MNTQYALPNGLVHFLDSCGMRAPSPPPTMAELEALGMQAGIAGAKEVLRIRGKRNPLRELAASLYREDFSTYFFKEASLSGYELSLEERRKFRDGIDRGMASQLRNPKARIEVKIVKASAVV